MRVRIGVVGLMSALLSGGSAFAQTASVVTQNSQPRVAGAKAITFEVASIRRNNTGVGGGEGATADGYDQKNMFPVLLVAFAYNVMEFQRIEGLPDWCRFGSEGYDIEAKVADSDVAEWRKSDSKQIQGALQRLLADRFLLKAHFETRDAPAYALVVARNGPKFKPAVQGDTYPKGARDRDGKPVIGIHVDSEPGSDHGRLIGQDASMAALAQLLSGFMNSVVGRQVVDQTGLAGQYDFTMPTFPEWASNHQAEEFDASIFTTLQESLGLKLEPSKIPMEFLVIDHIERPSQN